MTSRVENDNDKLANHMHPETPSGCLQFFVGSSGVIESFNYEEQGLNGNGARRGYLNNLEYSMCFRKELGACSISLKKVLNKESNFHIDSALRSAAAGHIECPNDFLLFNGIRLCGIHINDDLMANPTKDVLVTDLTNGPFLAKFTSDGSLIEVYKSSLVFPFSIVIKHEDVPPVRFPNSPCQISGSTRSGVCLTTGECTAKNGTSNGACADDHGVCCLVTLTQCGSTSDSNVTYWTNPGGAGGYNLQQTCNVRINKASDDICQFRVDFIKFVTQAPATGDCNLDRFTVSGQDSNNIIPTLCGINTGQHLYVDVGSSQGPIIFNMITSGSFSRSWEIQISQIKCSSAVKAPQGCLQYYTGAAGTIESFNYADAASTYLNNLEYSICYRKELGFCSYTLVQNDVTVNELSIQTVVTAGNAGAGITDCTTDFLIVKNQRLCGQRLNDDVVTTPATPTTASKPVTESFSIFVFRLLEDFIDRKESASSAPTHPYSKSSSCSLTNTSAFRVSVKRAVKLIYHRNLAIFRAYGHAVVSVAPERLPLQAFMDHMDESANTSTDVDILDAAGCLQYLTGVAGSIESFNYADSASTYLNNLEYSICFRKELSYCGYTVQQNDVIANPFDIQGGTPQNAGSGPVTCSNDYIIINRKRLCGERLNDGSILGTPTSVSIPVTVLMLITSTAEGSSLRGTGRTSKWSKDSNSRVQSSPNDRKSRLFNFLFVVRFPNDACNGSNSISGTCYTAGECTSRGGSASGSCASGYGVCCTFVLTTCGNTSSENCTYFQNPGFPSTYNVAQTCTIFISKKDPNICQFKYDLLTFDITAPTAGECTMDRFTISGQNTNSVFPALCGLNSGQTPPSNCLQYFTGASGTIKSFNYASTTAATLGYPNNLRYSICFRKEMGFCDITFTNPAGMTFHIEGDPAGQSGVGVANCATDFLVIGNVRYCSEFLNPTTGLTADLPVSDLTSGPFMVEFVSDGTITQRGFMLTYTQMACVMGG
ncbi:hypothetical protein GQR58_005417 [Nymphon striatum]|nr:hypothetical protein GQR58_005417 [Nymphon striatum]